MLTVELLKPELTRKQRQALIVLCQNPFEPTYQLCRQNGVKPMTLSLGLRSQLPDVDRPKRYHLFEQLGYIKAVKPPFDEDVDRVTPEQRLVYALADNPSASYEQLSTALGYSPKTIRTMMGNVYKIWRVQTIPQVAARLRFFERLQWFDADRLQREAGEAS